MRPPANSSGSRSGDATTSRPSAVTNFSARSAWRGCRSDAGAVRAGAGGAGDGLHVDVAQVLHREPALRERGAERVQARAGVHARDAGVGVDIDDALQLVQRHDDAVAGHQRAERVAGADHAHRLAVTRRVGQHLRQLRAAVRRHAPACADIRHTPTSSSTSSSTSFRRNTCRRRGRWRPCRPPPAFDQQQLVEALAQLAGLRVAEQQRVARRRAHARGHAHRRLHLARALGGDQRAARGQPRPRQAIGAARARRRIAAAGAGDDARRGRARDRHREAGGGPAAERAVVVEQRRHVQAGAGRELGDARVGARALEAAGAAAVDEAQRVAGRGQRGDGRAAAFVDLGDRAALEQPDHRVLRALAGHLVHQAGDLALVAHQAVEPQRRMARDLRGQRERGIGPSTGERNTPKCRPGKSDDMSRSIASGCTTPSICAIGRDALHLRRASPPSA
jgi:hypothetical protein